MSYYKPWIVVGLVLGYLMHTWVATAWVVVLAYFVRNRPPPTG